MFAVIADEGAHHHQFIVLFFFLAVVVGIRKAQGHLVLVHIHKGLHRVAVGVRLPLEDLPLAAVVAFAGILKVVGKVFAHHNRNLVFSKAHVAGEKRTIGQIKAHLFQCIRVSTIALPYTGFIAAVLAGENLAAQVAGLIIRRNRHHMIQRADLIQHLVVQGRGFRCAIGIVVDLNLGQVAPTGQHGLIVYVGCNSQADHHHNGAGAHHHTNDGQGCTALAAAKVVCAESQQIRYLHPRPPVFPAPFPCAFCG